MDTYIIIILSIIILSFLFYFIDRLGIRRYKVMDRFSNNEIPKIIIQTWKDNMIPDKYKAEIDTIKKLNPTYEYYFFTDDDIEVFFKENYEDYYKTYEKLPIKIQKIDFFRYVAVYHYGGIYLDLDMTGLLPFDDILKYDAVFPVDQNISESKCKLDRFKSFCDKDMKFLLGQYAFAAKPKHPFIKLLVDSIHNNIDKYIEDYKINGKELIYTYTTTGPDFVSNIYYEYPNKDKIHILHDDKSQFFGNYAKHNFMGSWKDNKKG
jgi:mannosyltransferase OCH1-like enzyme